MQTNPLDTIEDLIFSQEWPSERVSATEVMAEINGRWCEYHLHFVWSEEDHTLQFYILIVDIEILEEKRSEVYELMCRLNEKLSMGHFEVFTKLQIPAFRHSLVLPGTRTVSEALLEEMLENAIDTCEKFYPAFQYVIYGDKSPEDSANISMIDIAGEA